MNRGSSVGTVTRTTEELGFDFWQAQRDSSLLQSLQAESGSQTASYPVCIDRKAAAEA
jgi:hypothetical protein